MTKKRNVWMAGLIFGISFLLLMSKIALSEGFLDKMLNYAEKERDKSRDQICINNMKMIAASVEQMAMAEELDLVNAGIIEWNSPPSTGTFGVVGEDSYLKMAPICPYAGGIYTAKSGADGVVQMTCSGEGHNTDSMYNGGDNEYYTLPY